MEDKFQWYKPGFLPALLFLTGSTVLFFSQPDGGGDYADMIQLRIITQAVLFAMFFLMDEGLLELNRWNFAAPLAALSGCNQFCIMLNYHWYMTHGSALRLPISFTVFVWSAMLVAAIAAFVLNWLLRSPVPRESQPLPILHATMAKSAWVYWEHVEAKWMDGILALALLIPVAVCLKQPNIRSIALASIFVPLMLLFIGGFRYSISRDRIRLRWGWARIPLMNVQISDIAEVEVMESGVFRRFGGFGVRYSSTKGWGFVLRNSAVCLKTSKGRSIVFSTANPTGVAELITSARHSCPYSQ